MQVQPYRRGWWFDISTHRINSIDIARLLAAILVVAIHTQAVIWFSGYTNGSIQILTRVAVPFFFCTSGYFLHKKRVSSYSGCRLEKRQTIYFSVISLFRCNFSGESIVAAWTEEMGADGFTVQRQLLSPLVHGGHYLFNGIDRSSL